MVALGFPANPYPRRQWNPAMPFFFAVVALVCINALLFAVKAVNPLIASDSWHFVDVIVRKAAAGDLSIGDLFFKRDAFDHAQPLRKLILLFHYRFFDLDFSVETVIAMIAAFLNLWLLWLVAAATRIQGQRDGAIGLLLFAAMTAVYLSLNASVVFSWSLLTLNFTSHTFLLLFVIAFWRCIEQPGRSRLILLFCAALLADMVTDDTGLIVTAAALDVWRR